jgi:putative flippase GtrA
MRQPVLFVLVGGFQYLLDAALFGILITVGLGTVPSNITSRAAAAATGFLLNRYVTFSRRNDTVELFSASLFRFVIFWVVMTLVSTGLIQLLEQLAGDSEMQRIFYKLGVEAVLAVVSFFLSRNWVYRN